MPFWSKKPTLDDQVIELKMSSSTLNRQYKKCEAQALDYQKRMKAEIAKGNHETAKVYADSSVRMKAQGKQYMIIASRLEAAALNLQSVASMSTVSKAMATSVQAIKSASNSLDITAMHKAMNEFKTACEDNEVMMGGFINAVGNQDVASSESAEALYQQAAMEVANDKNANMGQVNTLGEVQLNAPAMNQCNPVGDNSDILNRLNKL